MEKWPIDKVIENLHGDPEDVQYEPVSTYAKLLNSFAKKKHLSSEERAMLDQLCRAYKSFHFFTKNGLLNHLSNASKSLLRRARSLK